MKITCEKKMLSTLVNNASKALPGKTTMPVLECVYLEAGNGKVVSRGTDMTEGIETTASEGVEVLEEGKCAVPARLLAEMVGKLRDGLVTLQAEGNSGKVVCGKAKFTFPCGDAEEYPAFPEVGEGEKIFVEKNALKDAIDGTKYAVSPTESPNVAFTAINFTAKDGNLSATALDGRRVATRIVPATVEPGKAIRFVSPGQTMGKLSQLLGEKSGTKNGSEVSVTVGKTLVSFRFDDIAFVARTLEAKPFPLETLENDARPTRVTVDKRELIDCLNRAKLICEGEDRRPVIFTVGDGELRAEIRSSFGGLDESMEANVSGPELKIGFNPTYLSEHLNAVSDEAVTIEFGKKNAPCAIFSSDGTERHFVLPVNFVEAAAQ